MTRTIVGLTIALVFWAGMSVGQGNTLALVPALCFSVFALNEGWVWQRLRSWLNKGH